jgi:hypothetical protein
MFIYVYIYQKSRVIYNFRLRMVKKNRKIQLAHQNYGKQNTTYIYYI